MTLWTDVSTTTTLWTTISEEKMITVRIADISTAETIYLLPPACTVRSISTVLSGTIVTADATITAYRNTTAITTGVVTIAYSGSAAGDIDSCSPTAYNTFDGSTQYLKLVGGGESTNTVPVIVTIKYVESV